MATTPATFSPIALAPPISDTNSQRHTESAATRLRTDVTLAPLERRHAPAMFAWMCHANVRDNLGLRSEPSLERTEAWIANAASDESIAPFAIYAAGRHVGNVVLDKLDPYLGTARLSVYVGEAGDQNSGVGTSAVQLALVHAFGELGMHKVWLTVHVHNARAIHSYTKLGFALEGVLRDEFWLEGRRVSAFYMGLLKSEFAARSAH